MATLVDRLSVPYAHERAAGLEKLRLAVLTEVLPGGTATARASRVVSWVCQSDLRSFFEGAPATNGVYLEGPNTKDLAEALDKRVPPLRVLRDSLIHADVGKRVLDVVGAYITSPLPHRRIEGYCALACLCAARRKDV